MREKILYTTGELAKMTGVSYKTIRHYYESGLLSPEKVGENGYKKFGNAAVEQLQKILMLKYLDFSLEDIKHMLGAEAKGDAFARQTELLKARKEHLEHVLKAVEEIRKMDGENQWDKMLEIIHMTTHSEELVKQYQGSENLQKRINIHDYSTASVPWFAWVLEGLQLESGMKILELGCGTAALWTSQRENLPENLEIILTDKSEGMLETARKEIAKHWKLFERKQIRFIFRQMGAEDMEGEKRVYDRIIANHMLYHVSEESRPQLLERCAESLKKAGMFYASTIGNTHMKELFELLQEFDIRMTAPGWLSSGFELENGGEQLKKAFSRVSMEEREDDLLVPDPEVLYQYIESLPGDSKKILAECAPQLHEFLKQRVSTQVPFFCHKSIGAFRAFVS